MGTTGPAPFSIAIVYRESQPKAGGWVFQGFRRLTVRLEWPRGETATGFSASA